MSMHSCAVLFVVVAVNFNRFQILQSYMLSLSHMPAEEEHKDHFAKLLSEVRERRKKTSGQEMGREGGEEQVLNVEDSKKDCPSTRCVQLEFIQLGTWDEPELRTSLACLFVLEHSP